MGEDRQQPWSVRTVHVPLTLQALPGQIAINGAILHFPASNEDPTSRDTVRARGPQGNAGRRFRRSKWPAVRRCARTNWRLSCSQSVAVFAHVGGRTAAVIW
jgi:hypothetical protein